MIFNVSENDIFLETISNFFFQMANLSCADYVKEIGDRLNNKFRDLRKVCVEESVDFSGYTVKILCYVAPKHCIHFLATKNSA